MAFSLHAVHMGLCLRLSLCVVVIWSLVFIDQSCLCSTWNLDKWWFICRDIIYLDSFNGVSCGFSAIVYFPKLWTGNQEVYENFGLYLCQVMSKTWCRGWEAMFVVITSFNQTLSGCWARFGQMSKLIPGKSHYFWVISKKRKTIEKMLVFLKWPCKTIIISIFFQIY